jgi:hypothetical protein
MKLLMTTGVLVAALALTGNAAMAATAPSHKAATTKQVAHAVTHVTHAPAPHRRAAAHVAHYRNGPNDRLGFDVGQFIQGMLGGGPVPYANLVRDVEHMHGVRGGSSYAELPTYDSSAPVSGFNDADAAAAAAAENNAIADMNNTNALTASMAAAEEQNDAANAATLQTEINSGM